MIKYDENYAAINAKVAAMPDAIQYIPPHLHLMILQPEASLLQTKLLDTFEVWNDAF